MEFPDLQLNEKALAKRHKMMDKVSRAEQNLAAIIAYHESNPSYVEKRDNDSVMSFQYRLDALNREEEEAVAKFREQFRSRRDNIQRRLEEAQKRMEAHKTCKPKAIHTAETTLKILLEEMDTYGLLTTKERQRLWELRGEAPPPSNTVPEPVAAPPATPSPPKEPELPADVKEFLAERGSMPANREELDLFKERKAMLQEMAREKREKEREEQEKLEEAKRLSQQRRELELQQEEQRQKAKRQAELDEAELVAKAVEAAKTPVPEENVEVFEGRKVSKFEKEQILKARKKQEDKKVTFEKEDESSDTENEEDDSSDSEIDEEEYQRLIAKQKAELRRKHEERMKKQQSFYTPPPPEVQEMPRIIANTKEKKPVKMAKK